MATYRIATILKVAIWPSVVLILVTLFMLLFRSSIDRFINSWESLKMGDIEVQVKSEEEKAFLMNVLAERNALITSMRQNVDSMKVIIKDLEIENEVLVGKLQETSMKLPSAEQSEVKNVVHKNGERIQASKIQAKSIEKSVEKDYRSLKTITSSEHFKQAAEQENIGFDLLLKDEFDSAIAAFKKSEAAYPTIRKERSLSTFVEQNLKRLNTDNLKAKKVIYAELLNKYSDKMSEKVRKQFGKIAQTTKIP